jgi:DNA-binding CsgD family transcriptional regulator
MLPEWHAEAFAKDSRILPILKSEHPGSDILFIFAPSMKLTTFHKHTLIYGASLAVLLFLMKWLEFRFIILDHALELYIGAIAVIFTALGIWLTKKLTKPKVETVIIEKEVIITQPATSNANFTLNEKALEKHGISTRELEVLQLMATGLSNQEIAERLYVSHNTIKTHSSNLFLKLDVKRRTQAVDTGRKLGLIP